MFQQFTPRQVSHLTTAFHRGAAEASTALGQWLNAPLLMSIDAVDQCPLEQAIGVLGAGDSAICVSVMQMQGTLTGHMLLAFDDASGLAISDLLLGRTSEPGSDWGDVELSCIQETMNIAGSSYLNGIARDLAERGAAHIELIPSPPHFLRDFAESLLESAFMEQAAVDSNVVFARARFELAGKPLRWTFLLIPDPDSLQTLSDILAKFA